MSYSSEVLADSPVAYWKLDETSGAPQDSSGNGNHATSDFLGTYGAAPLISVGTALSCNGSNQGFYTGTSIAAMTLSTGASRSVELWFKTTMTTQGQLVHWSGSANISLKINETAGKVSLVWGGSGTIVSSSALNDGAPHHVVATVTATTVTLYVDGVSQGTSARSSSTTTAPTCYHGFSSSLSNDFVGVLDEVAYYTSELSAARVSDHYAAGSASPAPALSLAGSLRRRVSSALLSAWTPVTLAATLRGKVGAFTASVDVAPEVAFAATLRRKAGAFSAAVDVPSVYAATVNADAPTHYWRLGDPGEDAALTDSAAAANHLGGGYIGPDVDGLVDGDDRARDHVRGATAPGGSVTSSAFSVEYVVRGQSLDWVAGFSKADTFTLAIDSSYGSCQFTVRGGADRANVAEVAAPTLGSVTHVAGTYDGATLRLYVGGVEVSSAPLVGYTGETEPSKAFRLDAVNATVDEVAYYRGVALPAGRVAAHADAVPTILTGAGTLPRKTGAFTLDSPPVLQLGGVLRRRAAAFVAAIVPSTDTANRVGGRSRAGHAVAEWSPAVVATPAHLATGHAVVRAVAYGPVTMQGAQPTFTVSEATQPRDRQRILIGGKDVTYFRDVATPEVPYQLADPLLWGPATIDLPQVAAGFEKPGAGALKWLKFGKQVVVQRVNAAGVVTGVDYRGVVVAFGASGSGITVECGGHAQGRAALREVPQPIFSSVRDVGMLAWRALGALGLELKPRTGPETGVEIGRVGGMSHLDYIRDLCVKAQTKSGKRWTIMPNDSGVYRMTEKDTTTVHATIFCDDARNVADLRRDMAEEPNRIFASGVSPEGKRIRFGVYPGLKHGEAPAYPFADGRTFGAGTTNAETTTGDGILVLTTRLRHAGYLSTDDAPGGYDNDCTRAVKHLQRDADLADTGNVNPATWDALFDLNVTGYSLTYSQVMPAAQRSAVRPERRSASGAVIGKNPNYDRSRLKVDRTIDVGTGFWRGQIREMAWNELADAATANWVGTITLNTGAVLAGLVAEGAAVTDADVMDVRDLRPGMNVWLPQFDGGTLLHVSGIDVSATSTRLTVDTRARDALEVWEVINRNRETRNNPARAWRGPKSSTEDKDSLDVWDEVGGILYGDVDLVAGWNVVPIVAGQAGTVSQIRLELGDKVEFACAVFGGKVAPKRLNHLIDEPLTKAGTEKWEKRAVRKVLDERGLLFAAGTKDEPCGYSPGRKLNAEGNRSDRPLRGVHKDDAGFSYLCPPGRPVLYLAVWVPSATTLKRGRVMWNQLEGGV